MPAISDALIYGAGAVGSIFGWRLAAHNFARVSVVCRSNYEQVRDAGFSFQTLTWGNGTMRPREVYHAANIPRVPRRSPFDVVVCATKITTEDFSSTIAELRPFVGPNTTLVSTQNGMDVELPLRRAFPANTILSAICNIGCTQDRPGHVMQRALIKPHAFHIGVHTIGDSQHARNSPYAMRDALAGADARFKAVDSVQGERWRKLVFNAALNSTCALTGLNSKELLREPGAADLVQHIATEASQVAGAHGVELPDDMASQVITMVQNSPAIVPSSLQDSLSGKPMELSPTFGYLVTQATRLGLPVPHLRVVYQLLQQMNLRLTAGRRPRIASAPTLLGEVTRGNQDLISVHV